MAVDDSNRTEWERQREREEFARTARVVQPLGSSLSTRFTRSQKEITTEGSTEEEVHVLMSIRSTFSNNNLLSLSSIGCYLY